MDLQEKIAVRYFLEATHRENEGFIIRDFYIRKGFKIDFKWQAIDISQHVIVFHQN